MRTKADFKALREGLGISQQLMADLMDVNIRSVKRWESPRATGYKEAPDEAWDILEYYLHIQAQDASNAVDYVLKNRKEGDPKIVHLAYWSNEEDYEAHDGDGKFWQMANATTRLAASFLRDMGYEVNFDYL